MAQFKKIALTHNGVLTTKAIKAYLEQKLSDEQMSEVATMISNDPFTKDAVEGFRSDSNMDAAIAVATAVRQKIKDNTGAGKASITAIQIDWTLLAYAAAFIGLVVGIGFVFMMYKDNASNEQLAVIQSSDTLIAEEKPEIENTEIVAAQTDEFISDSIADMSMESPAIQEPQSRGVEDVSAAKGTVADKKDAQPLALTAPKVAETKTEPAKNKTTSEKNDKAPTGKEATVAGLAVAEETADSDEAERLKVEKKTKEAAANFDKAMKLFNSGEYKNAGVLFESVLSSTPDNSEATYFSGVCNYINGNKPKAEQRFDKLIKKGSYTEGSKWYKANILLSKGNKDDAVKILKQLTSSTSVFKERAIKKLEEIEAE
jgi:TolA-binding protein